MTALYLLDTNTVSDLVKKHPHVTARVIAQPMAALTISAITEAELLFGLARRPEAIRLHRAVREFLLRVAVVPWTRAVAATYGPLRAALEAKGSIVAPIDLLIASHALTLGAVLVTNDQAFARVPGLVVENWTAHE